MINQLQYSLHTFQCAKMVYSLGGESGAPSIKCSINQFAIYFTACNFSEHRQSEIEKQQHKYNFRTNLFI